MRSLTAEEVLIAAERFRRETLPEAAAMLLAMSAMPREEAMALTVGERDARLVALRAATFGGDITGVATCPSCGERVQVEGVERAFEAARYGECARDDAVEVRERGWIVQARPPNGEEIAAALRTGDPRRTLLERCVLEAHSPAGETVMPAEVIAAVEEELERADPRADVRLALTCPACAHAWEAPFDIVSFFGSEIRAVASRLVHDVHVLAAAYGWREEDILAMSPWRRQMYIDLVGG